MREETLPSYQGEKGGNDENIIKHSKRYQQLVESLSELCPHHDDDGDSVS